MSKLTRREALGLGAGAIGSVVLPVAPKAEEPVDEFQALLKIIDEEEEEPWFLNYYECYRCGYTWEDEWSAMCDDDCPQCEARHCSPYKSEDLL